MKKIFDKFHDTQPAIIDDNGEAQTIMFELGVWDAVSRIEGSANTTAIIAETHETHWCLCVQIRDNPDPKENGFMVITYPKKTVDLLSVNHALQTFLGGSSELSVKQTEYKPPR